MKMNKISRSKALLILEIETSEVRLIGQLLHMYKLMEPDDTRSDTALEKLRQQTNVVFSNAKTHCVYDEPLSAPSEATPSPPVYYIKGA